MKLFGCPVSFGADANRLSIGLAETDHALPTGNRDLAAMHDRALVEQLARLDKKDVMARFLRLAARAHELRRSLPAGQPGDLNMSRRSLQRRLAEAEATYQSLVDETRRDMALRYLEDPGKSATDIALPRLLPAERVHARLPALDGQESLHRHTARAKRWRRPEPAAVGTPGSDWRALQSPEIAANRRMAA